MDGLVASIHTFQQRGILFSDKRGLLALRTSCPEKNGERSLEQWFCFSISVLRDEHICQVAQVLGNIRVCWVQPFFVDG
jgi:hypothetical protein